jgi:putative Holliday junction resolvase
LPRILAVDWGERRIGLAVSDALGILATGLPTLEIRGEAEAVARVADTIRNVEADSVVVGLPLTLAGGRGEAARAAERFAEALRHATNLEVALFDERLTSAMAERRMHERGEKSRGRKGRVDQGAAVALLEGWLARLRYGRADDAGEEPTGGAGTEGSGGEGSE